MKHKIVIITPNDTVECVDYKDYTSLHDAVGGLIEHFMKTEIPVISMIANGKDKLPVDFYCNEEFLILNDEKFDKVNAVASLLSGSEIRGNVAVVVNNGDDSNRGFEYEEEDVGNGLEEALCECWSVEDTILNYMHQNKDKLKELHRQLDNNKSKPYVKSHNIDID